MRSFSPAIVVGLHTIFPKKIFTSGAYRDGAGFNLLIYIEMITQKSLNLLALRFF
jgi:hypothetical protein